MYVLNNNSFSYAPMDDDRPCYLIKSQHQFRKLKEYIMCSRMIFYSLVLYLRVAKFIICFHPCKKKYIHTNIL